MREQSVGRRVLEEMKQRAAITGEPSHDTVEEFRANTIAKLETVQKQDWYWTWEVGEYRHDDGSHVIRYQDGQWAVYDDGELVQMCSGFKLATQWVEQRIAEGAME